MTDFLAYTILTVSRNVRGQLVETAEVKEVYGEQEVALVLRAMKDGCLRGERYPRQGERFRLWGPADVRIDRIGSEVHPLAA